MDKYLIPRSQINGVNMIYQVQDMNVQLWYHFILNFNQLQPNFVHIFRMATPMHTKSDITLPVLVRDIWTFYCLVSIWNVVQDSNLYGILGILRVSFMLIFIQIYWQVFCQDWKEITSLGYVNINVEMGHIYF